jgi:hypothetical protein
VRAPLPPTRVNSDRWFLCLGTVCGSSGRAHPHLHAAFLNARSACTDAPQVFDGADVYISGQKNIQVQSTPIIEKFEILNSSAERHSSLALTDVTMTSFFGRLSSATGKGSEGSGG